MATRRLWAGPRQADPEAGAEGNPDGSASTDPRISVVPAASVAETDQPDVASRQPIDPLPSAELPSSSVDAATRAAAASAEADKVAAQIDEQAPVRMLAGEEAAAADATAREAEATHEAALRSTAASEERAAAADDAAGAAKELAEGVHELKHQAENRAGAAAKAAERAQMRAHFAADARIDADNRAETAAAAQLEADARAAEAARADAFAEQLAQAAARERDAHAVALVAAENSAARLQTALAVAKARRERLAEVEAEHDRLQDLLRRERARAAEAEARAVEARAAEESAAALRQHEDAEREATLTVEQAAIETQQPPTAAEPTLLGTKAPVDDVQPCEQKTDDSPVPPPHLSLPRIGGRRKQSRWSRLKMAFGTALNPQRPLGRSAPPPRMTRPPTPSAPTTPLAPPAPIDVFAVLDPLWDEEPPAPPEAPYVDTDERHEHGPRPELVPEPAGSITAEEEPTRPAPTVSTPRQVEAPPTPVALPEPAQTDEPRQHPVMGAQDPPAVADPATGSVPSFVEYRQSEAWRWLIGAAFAVLSVLAVVAVFAAVGQPSGRRTAFALVATAAACLAWWALLNWAPMIVSISNGVLEVTHGDRATSVDLGTASDRLELSGEPGSRAWRAVVRRPEGGQLTIHARRVDTAEFTSIVQHYADGADLRPEPGTAHSENP